MDTNVIGLALCLSVPILMVVIGIAFSFIRSGQITRDEEERDGRLY